MALCNQPDAFALDRSVDQSRYLFEGFAFRIHIQIKMISPLIIWLIIGALTYVHSQQHTYMSSSYGSLGLSYWDPYAVDTGSCVELPAKVI